MVKACSTSFNQWRKEEAKNEQHNNTKSYVQGLLLYHPILLSSPWQALDDIDDQIGLLLQTNEPIMMARYEKEYDLGARESLHQSTHPAGQKKTTLLIVSG